MDATVSRLSRQNATASGRRLARHGRRPLAWAGAVIAVLALTVVVVTAGAGSAGFLSLAAAAGAIAGAALVLATRGRDDDAGLELIAEAVDHSPHGVMVTDADGGILYRNVAFGARFGPMSRLDLRAAEAEEWRRLQKAAAAGNTARDRLRLPSAFAAAGTWVEVRAFPVDGAVASVAWELVDDNTEASTPAGGNAAPAPPTGNDGPPADGDGAADRADATWQIAELLDAAPVGFFVADAAGRFRSVNRELAERLGYETGAMTAEMGLADIVIGDPPPPAEAGQPAPARLALRRRDGSEMPAMLMRTSIGDGATARQLAVVNDLTPATGAVSTRSTEERFRRFFDFAPVAALMVDLDGAVVVANPALLAMASDGADPTGRQFLDLVAAEDRDDVARRLDDSWAGKRDGMMEVHLSELLGRRPVQLYASRLETGSGDAAELLVNLVDMAEQRNLELQFAQGQKMQAVGQLAGGVAHDFNNLLTAIIGHCDLLLLRARPGDESFPDIMQVKQNANRAANLVRQLLAFSRQQTLRPKVLSLTDVLAELSHLLQRLIGENIELKLQHERDLGLVKADQGQLEQVIINLAVNARDAMPRGGTLSIVTRNVSREESVKLGHDLMPAADYVEIEVQDTGKGISPEDLGKIFEPFFTTKQPGTGAGSGTGLGLATVYGIVKQTGGFIFPKSEVGRGTAFRIYLPRLQQVETERPADDDDEAGGPDGKPQDLTGKGTIMLVEDEDAVRVFAARALRNKGYTVLEANGGEAALKALAEHDGKIDLLISDVVMPQMDGPTLIKRVRQTLPDLKVIYISGYAEDAFRRNLDPDADFDLLPKPFSLKQLAGKVKSVIDGERV